ncbi:MULTISPECIES: hypothetical protein [Streptomyces]|uniref:hypothetical protein n=1 Tax=Streptomyces TaxID=1883 RepID=UPI0004C508D1|nr:MULTISPECIES: hypothetical protein [Streptomyces]MDX3606546.1 hypothetical protein [Streptomyces sp. FL06-04B]MDX3737800.1 hypothetical protein [Streptomyces sp. ID01-15D]
MSDARAYLALCTHTHLFPGARCRLQDLPHPAAFATAPEPIEVYLSFSDGTATAAALHTGSPAGPTLAVAAYTTAAGTPIDDSAWAVKGIAQKEDDVELTIGTPNRA